VILSNLRGYFLQQPLLQHCLPLQQALVCALTGDAAKQAARLAISRRYFIRSSFEFRHRTRPRTLCVPSHRSGELSARRRNGRTVEARCYAIIVHQNCAAHLCTRGKCIADFEVKEQADGWPGAARGRTRRGCSARVDWTADARIHIHVRATSFLLGGWKRFAWKNRR
jgi:hypothetical protein